MGTHTPTTVFIPVDCAPKKAPCPKCGKKGRRKRTFPPRLVRTVAFRRVAYLKITCGEYQARCGCCTTFRSTPEGVLPRAQYDHTVRELVLDRILTDGMNVEQTLDSLRREFLLDLSTGFIYDSASMNCTWGPSRCCWPRIPWVSSPWPSPWSPPMIRATCWASSRTSRTGA
jgi:hypothetical protein